MKVGVDGEGRTIEYDQATGRFAIAGIDTSIDRVIAYDRGGNVEWESDEMRSWAHEFEATRQEQLARAQAVESHRQAEFAAQREATAARASVTAPGYDALAITRYAGSLNGIATALLVVNTVAGALMGLIMGSLSPDSAPVLMLVTPLVFGAIGFAFGYLQTIVLKVSAYVMKALVQIEMNSRRGSA